MGKFFTKAQWRIFFGCFVAYAGAYVARLNLSAALPGMMAGMNLTDAQGGMFQTGFALIYAAGQLVNGSLVDKISARRYILIGTLASALCNVLVGAGQSYGVLLAGWCLNGVAQSMLWTPVVKMMATWFHGKFRGRVSFGISMTLIVGHLCAWAIAGFMATMFSWRLSFFIPAAVIAGMGILAFILLRDKPTEADLADERAQDDSTEAKVETEAVKTIMPIRTMILGTGLLMVLLCCVGNGFVRDGVITWAPTIIGSIGAGMPEGSSVIVSLIIPVLNFMGVLVGRRVYAQLGNNARKCVMLLMVVSSVLSILILVGSKSMVLCALLLGLTCAATYGINPMLTTLIPMEFTRAGRVGLVAGVIDCFIYLGSSLAGIATGAMSDMMGWNAVFITWCIVAGAGAVMAWLSLRDRDKLLDWGMND